MKKIFLATSWLFITLVLGAQTNVVPEISLVPFADGFDNPVGLERAGDNRWYVVEQPGKIKIVDALGVTQSEFLDLTAKIKSDGFEQGLLGLAFDPDYANNGFFYIHYTNLEGNSQFSRFSVDSTDPDKALPNSEIPFLEDDDPYENHNGGQMKFGPDGYLYFTLGDGGSGGDPLNNAQDASTILGKLMRIDPNDDGSYSIPSDNPYAEQPLARGEIWATGLRNPWRFSFDLMTGDLWIPDVGQDGWEEINYQPASSLGGENYGWSCREGNHFFKLDCDENEIPFTNPIAEYAHDEDTTLICSGSVTGGYIYRGSLYPNMFGKYFYTDFCTGVMRATYWNGLEWVSFDLGRFTPLAYSTFGEDIDGELLLADKTNGIIYRVTDESHPTAVDDLVGIRSLLLTPNPNHGAFSLEFNSRQNAQYITSLFDLTGHKIWSVSKEAIAGKNEWTFNQPDLPDGQYVLQVLSFSELNTVHVVKL